MYSKKFVNFITTFNEVPLVNFALEKAQDNLIILLENVGLIGLPIFFFRPLRRLYPQPTLDLVGPRRVPQSLEQSGQCLLSCSETGLLRHCGC